MLWIFPNQSEVWMEKRIDDRSEDHVTINAYKIGASEASREEVIAGKYFICSWYTHTSKNKQENWMKYLVWFKCQSNTMKQLRMDHTISFFHTSSIAILLQLYTSANWGENDVIITLKQHFYCRRQTLLWFCPLSHFHAHFPEISSHHPLVSEAPSILHSAQSSAAPGLADIGYKCYIYY